VFIHDNREKEIRQYTLLRPRIFYDVTQRLVSYLSTFRNYLSVPSSRSKQYKKTYLPSSCKFLDILC